MDDRAQGLYWTELVQLKVDCEYFRHYRDSLSAWVTRFALLRAVVGVGALGAWAAVRGAYPLLWGGVIAATQVADAVQNAIPFTTRLRATSALTMNLDALFIDCQMEWEDVFSARLDEAEVTKRRHAMMKRRHEVGAKELPNGIPFRADFFMLAEAEAATYFEITYKTKALR